MISPVQQDLLRRLAELCELSPDVRFGQLLAHLGLMVEDRSAQSFWEIEDEDLLGVMDHHRDELSQRQAPASALHAP